MVTYIDFSAEQQQNQKVSGYSDCTGVPTPLKASSGQQPDMDEREFFSVFLLASDNTSYPQYHG
jgi:hypothetical protein